MPFQLVAVKQAKSFSLTGQASPLSLSFDSSVSANSSIVVIGSAIDATDRAALLGTVTGGSATWGSATNTRSAGDDLPNVCAAVGVNVSAGSPTFTIPFTTNGVASTNFRFTGMLIEVEKVPISGVVANTVTGTSSGATSTSTSATGTLAQTDNLVILCAGGWFGLPVNPAGYTERLNVQNGTYIGCHVSTKKVTATTTQTGTVSHDSALAASAILLVLKAADDSAYKYEFPLVDSAGAAIASGITNMKAIVCRNRDPYTTGSYEYYTGLTSSAGKLVITSGLPGGLSLSDTLRVSVESSDASIANVGWSPGEVKAV
jgi:hypothetical protein